MAACNFLKYRVERTGLLSRASGFVRLTSSFGTDRLSNSVVESQSSMTEAVNEYYNILKLLGAMIIIPQGNKNKSRKRNFVCQ